MTTDAQCAFCRSQDVEPDDALECALQRAYQAGACAEREQVAKQIAELAHRCEVLENGPEMLVRGMRKARALVIARGVK